MKAIEDEITAAEKDEATEAAEEEARHAGRGELPDFSGRGFDSASEGESGGDDEGEDLMAMLKGSMVTLGATGSDDEGDGALAGDDDGPGSDDCEYVPSMPKELVRAFRRVSMSVPAYTPKEPASP